jgi:hypothetical protein
MTRHFIPAGVAESAAARMADLIAAGRAEDTDCDLGGGCVGGGCGGCGGAMRDRTITYSHGSTVVTACDEHWADYCERNDHA